MKRLLSLLLLVACAPAGQLVPAASPEAPDFRLSGGKATVFDSSSEAFSHRFPDMQGEHRTQFFSGESLFDQSWVTAVSSTEARDGLGPYFNARSCAACHGKDGRSSPFNAAGTPAEALLVRLSSADNKPHGIYGSQLQPFAIKPVPGEGQLSVKHQPINGTFSDGTAYQLMRPEYQLEALAYGEIGEIQLSVRQSPQLIGLGLLEQIPDTELLAHADPEDLNHDGISGRVNQVADLRSGQPKIGRFGWKANQPSIEQQVAAAFSGDIGISTSLFPAREQTETQQSYTAALPDGGSPELADRLLDRVVFYIQNLAVPARRDLQAPAVSAGEAHFKRLNCMACHRPAYELNQLSQKPDTIRPYSDLLLHDMGPGLADGRPDGAATGSEWRTPPLWGIGLIETVNGHSRYLHDGRARNLEEAVLWHGGEAETSRKAYESLTASERAELLAFLKSL